MKSRKSDGQEKESSHFLKTPIVYLTNKSFLLANKEHNNAKAFSIVISTQIMKEQH